MAVGDKIPKEIRKDVIRIFTYVKARLPHPPDVHMDWLFEVYNTHVEPNRHKPRLTSCRTDCGHVINIISTYVNLWKRQEQNS